MGWDLTHSLTRSERKKGARVGIGKGEDVVRAVVLFNI